jgi:hypothetical protein
MFSISGNRWVGEIGKAVFVIFLVTFAAHFVFFPLFGLYEDDYLYTLPTMNFSWHDFRQTLLYDWLYPVQARPLNHFLRHIFFFFTVRHGHLGPGFLLSWVLVSANGVTLYSLIRRILPYASALIGALAFVLFPLDTSRQILMHQTDLLVPIFLLLICLHLYLSGRYWMAYTLIGISLLDLESLFPMFLAAPILAAGLTRALWKSTFRKLAIHAVIMGVLFGMLVIVRMLLGEGRALSVASNPIDTALRMLRLATEGPWHGLEALVLRPIDGVIHCSPTLLPYLLVTIAVTAWGLSNTGSTKPADTTSATPPERRAAFFVFIAGIVAWSLSYVLWIPDDYFPPVVGIGRLSGEHSAAAIGAGLVSAGLAAWVFSYSHAPKRILTILFSCYFGALVAFGVQIQLAEYVSYWEGTKRFWTDLLNQIRDIQEGDVVIVEQSSDPRAMPVTKGFGEFAEESYFPEALPLFVDFPKTWESRPRVYGLWKGCATDVLGESIKIHTPIWAPNFWPIIHSGNFIYFRVVDGRLERVAESVTIEGKNLLPKAPLNAYLPPLPLSKSYQNLVSPPNDESWFTLRDARNYPH